MTIDLLIHARNARYRAFRAWGLRLAPGSGWRRHRMSTRGLANPESSHAYDAYDVNLECEACGASGASCGYAVAPADIGSIRRMERDALWNLKARGCSHLRLLITQPGGLDALTDLEILAGDAP